MVLWFGCAYAAACAYRPPTWMANSADFLNSSRTLDASARNGFGLSARDKTACVTQASAKCRDAEHDAQGVSPLTAKVKCDISPMQLRSGQCRSHREFDARCLSELDPGRCTPTLRQ
jgi:hypothetical protein